MTQKPLQQRIGSAEISRTEPVVAGSLVDFTITYTAGYFGIDDTGSIKICTRFAHPATRFLEDPQLGPAATVTTQQVMMGDITHLRLQRTIPLWATGDTPLYVCVTQENGHLAWSSPIYVLH